MVYWPLGEGRRVTSPFGPRKDGFHTGTDFGRDGGSASMPVYAVDGGTVRYCGRADGYGGPDPAGWIVVESPSGCWEYGHIVRDQAIRVGARVEAGQRIGKVNPDTRTNGGTPQEPIAPHLHLSYMPGRYDPNTKRDPMPVLAGANEPEGQPMAGWTGDPIWLADVLRPVLGDKLKGLPSWKEYGHGDYGDIWGVMVHHTGNANADAWSIRNGRPDLQGPLSNLHIAQDGTTTIVAAGVCWHAGMGSYPGLPTNNANFHVIGIECAWPRDLSLTPATQTREPWPDPEIISMRDTVAAILNRLGYGSDRVIAHKEWAGAAQGKWDPGNLDMNWFRGEVAKAQRGDFLPTPPAPPQPPTPIPPSGDVLAELARLTEKIDRLSQHLGVVSA